MSLYRHTVYLVARLCLALHCLVCTPFCVYGIVTEDMLLFKGVTSRYKLATSTSGSRHQPLHLIDSHISIRPMAYGLS